MLRSGGKLPSESVKFALDLLNAELTQIAENAHNVGDQARGFVYGHSTDRFNSRGCHHFAGDVALEAIGLLTQLKEFRTWHTAQTQAGNAHLARLPLTSLRIGQRLPSWGKDSPISFDESTMTVIAQIKTLESLELTEARLSTKIIPQLKALPKLTKLKIQTVDIPAADVEAIKAALPNCKVDFEPMSDADKEATLVKKLRL